MVLSGIGEEDEDQFFAETTEYGQDGSDLAELERHLDIEVDKEFFVEPRHFHTIHRSTTVLRSLASSSDNMHRVNYNDVKRSPIFERLQNQQKIVQSAIENMTSFYSKDLVKSVSHVTEISKEHNDALDIVRVLRGQVREIQETIGAASNNVVATGGTAQATDTQNNQISGNTITQKKKSKKDKKKKKKTGESDDGASDQSDDDANNNSKANDAQTQAATAMSLRELWLKKLESEALLRLLDKFDVIRVAPSKFDSLIRPLIGGARIGAAVLCLSQALDTMFVGDDGMAEIHASNKILQQLISRKHTADKLIKEILAEVIYLRTANNLAAVENKNMNKISRKSTIAQATLKSNVRQTSQVIANLSTINNPFFGKKSNFSSFGDGGDDFEDSSVNSQHSGASLFSIEEYDIVQPKDAEKGPQRITIKTIRERNSKKMMIPIPMLDRKIDLEADERRNLQEESKASTNYTSQASSSQQQANVAYSGKVQHQPYQLPKYRDPVLALLILTESLRALNRLNDVERIIKKELKKELRNIVQQQQANTFEGLTARSLRSKQEMKDFRRHLTRILVAFGCILVRISHLAQILRHKQAKENKSGAASPSQALRMVLIEAENIMEDEIKEFLKACVDKMDARRLGNEDNGASRSRGIYLQGFFSLGIVDSATEENAQKGGFSSHESRGVTEMSTSRFVSEILFKSTKSSAQYSHALIFRRIVAKWTTEVDELKQQLSIASKEKDIPSTPNIGAGGAREERSIEYLDKIIKNKLLPEMKNYAVDANKIMLERNDAFDPVKWNMYGTRNVAGPLDVDMCKACEGIQKCTAQLFAALHRLPRGGEMYNLIVTSLDHILLAFVEKIKTQVEEIGKNKTALELLGRIKGLSRIVEERAAYKQLLNAYTDDDKMADGSPAEDDNNAAGKGSGGMRKLDTNNSNAAPQPVEEDLEKEERIFAREREFLKKYLDFVSVVNGRNNNNFTLKVCTDDELMKASCLAHSLLKLAHQLENRLRIQSGPHVGKRIGPRDIRNHILKIKSMGMKMAKLTRFDMIMQTITRLSKTCESSTLVARDAIRIPSSMNEFGKYLTDLSDNLREAAGNAITAYTLSSLEQYVPHCLIETVNVIKKGEGITKKYPLTSIGMESLRRSGMVLFRDLKTATNFDGSFWDVELAADSFEKSIKYIEEFTEEQKSKKKKKKSR